MHRLHRAPDTLTDTHCRNAKLKPKLYRLTDHRGLCLEVKPSGVKAWHYRFTLDGKASMFARGEYPAVSLAEARDRCEAARQLVKQGINPAQQRQIDRIKQASDAEMTFEKVAREWLQTKDWEDVTKNRRLDMLERVVFGEIGQMPIRAITPAHVLGKQIDLEYSDSPLRLDPRNLTVVADTPERGVTMREIGSGENHVGYHIVAHLALHTWFARRERPVPSFLLLDQLSQAHFSPDTLPGNGVTQEKIDADRQAVKRLFNLIFDVVEKLGGKFQVLITDHPDFSDDSRFQAALRERWRDGLKLVPEDWPRAA